MKNIIEAAHVSRCFKMKKAVDNITFSVPEHSIYGLVGPNGSGKTTLIRMLMGLLRPDSGIIMVLGGELEKLDRTRIGYLPESIGLYSDERVMEQLVFWMRLKGVETDRAREIALKGLDRLGIGDCGSKRVSELSKGQQQRVAFLASSAWRPDLLVLDEPFTGLDPLGVETLADYIKALRDEGSTIILSSHFLECLERLCDTVSFVKNGEIYLESDPRIKAIKVASAGLWETYRRLYQNGYQNDR